MGLPPLHRVDHVPTYVLSFDSAWDEDTLKTELDAIKDPKAESLWSTVGEHPWTRYVSGESRADISTVSNYLLTDPPSPPVLFKFRRLNHREMAMVEARQETSIPAGRNLALSLALEDASGFEFSRGGRGAPHSLDHGDMERLSECVGDQGFRELGNQAIACSRKLFDREKKL